MVLATITSKGQMTLPKEIRDDLQLKPGDKVILEKAVDGYLLRPRRSALELFAELPRYEGSPVSIEQMDVAIEEELSEHHKSKA